MTVQQPIRIDRPRQKGQAMSEFVVAAAFVLVPLFLIIPALGKYADMKYSAVQAARYQAWEYTANYIDLGDQPSGFDVMANSAKPYKSVKQVQRETQRRIYSRTGTTLSTAHDRRGFVSSDANPLWVYHDGLPMYDPGRVDRVSTLQPSEPTPDPTYVLSGILRVLDTVLGAFASVLNAVGAPFGFDALNGNGYSKSKIALQVEPPPQYATFQDSINRPPLFLSNKVLSMQASAGVLTDGWSAGGGDHTLHQAKGLVPTSLLDVLLNPGGFPLQDIAATVLLSPELSRSSLQFGYMEKDTIHPSKLAGGGAHACSGGYCEFQ